MYNSSEVSMPQAAIVCCNYDVDLDDEWINDVSMPQAAIVCCNSPNMTQPARAPKTFQCRKRQ